MADLLPPERRALPRVAYGDPAAGARVLAELIPTAIAKAEALGAVEVAGHLRMALLVVERRASQTVVSAMQEIQLTERSSSD